MIVVRLRSMMRYNVGRGRGRPPPSHGGTGDHRQQQQQPAWAGFLTTLVSTLQSFMGGPPPPRDRGGRGRARGTQRDTGMAPPQSNQTPYHEAPPARGRSSRRGRSGGRGRSRGGPSRSRSRGRGQPRPFPDRQYPPYTGNRSISRGRGQPHPYPNGQRPNQAPPNRQFDSQNPDFPDLVKGFNQGARLENARRNWQNLPNKISENIDRTTSSIRPPLIDDKLTTKLKRAAENFKYAIHHAVSEHVTEKYHSVCRHLASVDDTDFQQAQIIANRQLVRGSGRINYQKAEELTHLVRNDYFPKRRQNHDWRLVRGNNKNKPTEVAQSQAPPSNPLPVETQNRFQVLADLNPESETIQIQADIHNEDIRGMMETSFSDIEEEAPRQGVIRSRGSSSSADIPPTPCKKKKLAAPLIAFKTPMPVVPMGTPPVSMPPPVVGPVAPPTGGHQETDQPSSTRPGASSDAPAVITAPGPEATGGVQTTTSGYNLRSSSADNTVTPKATQTLKHLRLCCFSPNYRSTWAIPEVLEDEDTLVLTDSNGKTLAIRAPANWRVAAYRGGKLSDAVRVLERCPIPTNVQTLIILMGINDRSMEANPPLINTATRLRDLLNRQTRRTIILSVPFFIKQPIDSTFETTHVNKILAEAFDGSNLFNNLPPPFYVVNKTPEDYAHYDEKSAELLVKYILRALQDLN